MRLLLVLIVMVSGCALEDLERGNPHLQTETQEQRATEPQAAPEQQDKCGDAALQSALARIERMQGEIARQYHVINEMQSAIWACEDRAWICESNR